jgi:hypothetical protein
MSKAREPARTPSFADEVDKLVHDELNHGIAITSAYAAGWVSVSYPIEGPCYRDARLQAAYDEGRRKREAWSRHVDEAFGQ